MDEAQLKVLIESTTNALDELRALNDPSLTMLVQDLERTRAELVAELANVRSSRDRKPQDAQPQPRGAA